ncbi:MULTISPECIES: FHA domain-containing protein [Actinomadura]|uniref:FHA domain-containing protein n=1 Tax=Actinomadura TaxID=1988 RepID=UPI000400EB08|nr:MULTISPECIES: FHA domain-containing protein [Actinomadura]RSN51024.1 FHA domain-containing protein [Actinomadura sp. WAC 06369]
MAICPSGHTSQSADFCDMCGTAIGAGAAPPSGGGGPDGGTPCPDCGLPGTDRFCEGCGYDFVAGGGRPTRDLEHPPAVPPLPPSTPASPPSAGAQGASSGAAAGAQAAPAAAWTAVVDADREYFNAVLAEEGPDSGTLVFPPYAPQRRIPLASGQVRIGRRSSTQPTPPEIDLREPPEDPGVSKVHAVLLAKPDGSWTLVDPGSTNRTYLNGSMDPIPLNTEVPLAEGDRIHVGAWTTITLTRGEAP